MKKIPNFPMKILPIVLLAVLTACGSRTEKAGVPEEAAAGGRIVAMSDSVRSDTVDLGTIRPGEIIRRDLRLHNGYGVPMVILSVTTSCGWRGRCLFVPVRQPGIHRLPAQENHAENIRFGRTLRLDGDRGDRRMTFGGSAAVPPVGLLFNSDIVLTLQKLLIIS